jgi:cholesterol oxidase
VSAATDVRPPLPAVVDTVVIGSGFGGAIAARRLAAAGRAPLVLERGRAWLPGQFPRDPFDGRSLLWRRNGRDGWRGLYDLRFHSGLATLAASGLGGGSLVYANVLVRPDERVFDERWPDGTDLEGLGPWYDRVEADLRPQPVPDTVPLVKHDAYESVARALGREADFLPLPLAVDWKGDHACRLVAQCEFGCPFGAKRTLDRHHIPMAEGLGATIRTETLVRGIEPVSGAFRVHVRDLPTGALAVVRARTVVLAAGTLGTTELLLRGRDIHGTLPGLSRRLGERFSGNGDMIGIIRGTREQLTPWVGPDVTAVLRTFDDEGPGFTLALPTFAEPVMRALVGVDLPPPPAWARAATWWGLDHAVPLLLGGGLPTAALRRVVGRSDAATSGDETTRAAINGAHDPGRATATFAIGRDSANGRLLLRRHGRGHRLDVEWPYASENALLVVRMERTLADLAAAYGGTYVPGPTWRLARKILSVHPLGGCAIAGSPAEGVCDPEGRVFGYPGLWVADGSLVPSSIGFHPALTVAALAERAAAAMSAG